MTNPLSSSKRLPKLRFGKSIFSPISARNSCIGLYPARPKSSSPAGDVLMREGDPADALFVLLEGEVRGRRENGGGDAPGFVAQAGQVTGMLPFSRMTHFGMTARATTPTWVLRLHKDHFEEMLQRIPGAAAAFDRRVGRSNSRVQPRGAATRQIKCAWQALRRIGSRTEQSTPRRPFGRRRVCASACRSSGKSTRR